MPEPWVINASPVILLAKAGLMVGVSTLASPLVIPEPVRDEITGLYAEDAAGQWLDGPGKQFVRPAIPELAELFGAEIGAGERSVISWAVTHPGFIAVLDDREARDIARRLGVRILGTVGVILRLKEAGVISEAKPHLLEIRRVGGYISNELFHEALRRAGEKS